MAFEEYWNDTHKKYSSGLPQYDDWLDKYEELLKQSYSVILDLGCGTGNDTLYLKQRNYQVLSCDYSSTALEILKQYIPDANTMLIDIASPLPFSNESFDLIIADLSLHYFDELTTINEMKEIKRILSPKGHLVARVNSYMDINFGAGKGKKLEENFYYVDGYNKRFFTLDDAKKYFGIIGEVKVMENEMTRYSKPKKVIEICVNK
jgi:SAM-dependent methyltransferase